jgi:hypothetical protein
VTNRVLTLAVQALLGHALAAPSDSVPPRPDDLREGVDATPFAGLKIQPVPPGHEKAPKPKHYTIDKEAGVLYILEADWPKLRDALARRRAGVTSGDPHADR